MIQKPQIIVIPQNLLSEQSKTFLKMHQQTLKPNRKVLPNLISSSYKPTAAIVGSMRPVPALSPDIKQELKRSLSPELDDDEPARKRTNLDHLSTEERMMRRKLKNREAAQTARDKKKAYIDELEAKLEEARYEARELGKQNYSLVTANKQLQLQNANLLNRNKELEQRLSQTQSTDILPPSPQSLPRTPSPTFILPSSPTPSTAVDHQTPPEPAVLSPLPQESGVLVTRHSSGDLGLSSSDLTTWSTSCVLQQMLMWSVMILSLTNNNNKMSVLSATKSLTASLEVQPLILKQQQQLPPKKRSVWSALQAWDPPPLKSPPLE